MGLEPKNFQQESSNITLLIIKERSWKTLQVALRLLHLVLLGKIIMQQLQQTI